MVGPETEAAARFRASALLGDADEGVKLALLDVLVEERFPAGAVLMEQGAPNDRLVFLIGGTASVIRTRPDGRAEAMATFTAPTVFGTTSFFRAGAVPTFGVHAAGDVTLLSLTRADHERLRKTHPAAAEALALDALKTLSDRFDELDRLFHDYIARHPDDHPKVTEWSGFRARLFEEHGI